jgi:Cu/Ag efflux pump CusA
MGHKVTQVLEGQRTYDLVVRYRDALGRPRGDPRTPRSTRPGGARVPLKMLATIRDDVGPNTIMRENVQRRIVVIGQRQRPRPGGVVDDIRRGIERA